MAAEAKRVNPDNVYVHKMHGWCLVNLGFDKRALEEFRKAIELGDGEFTKDLRAALAICYWHLGENEKATQHYQKLIKLDSDYGKAEWLKTELGWTEREKEALIELQKRL